MTRVYSDMEKMSQAATASSNGEHSKAARLYQNMGNEIRNPNEKSQLWNLAEKSRKKLD
jgi:hypothetical protein